MILLRDLATSQHAAKAANHRALGSRAAAGHLASDHRASNAADNRVGAPTASFDVTLATPDGEVCVEIAGFNIHRLEGGLTFAAPDPRELSYDDVLAKPVSPAEERLLHAFSQGIQPAEGAEAFGRAVALGGSQIIVSSLSLPDLIRQTADAEAAKAEGKAFERPDLDTAYVEPRNDVERTLVGFWQELLGVAQVGVLLRDARARQARPLTQPRRFTGLRAGTPFVRRR